MKNLIISVLLCFVVTRTFGAPISVQVKVIDDVGSPVSGANVLVLFQDHTATPISEQVLKSDADGIVRTQGETLVGVTLRAWKPGHYETETEFSISPKRPIERTYVMPRVLNPIPLFAARNETIRIPAKGEWVSYDFEAHDWIFPYGKGKIADIRFRLTNEFKGYDDAFPDIEAEKSAAKAAKESRGLKWSEEEFKWSAGKWDGVLEVSFAGPKEGIVEEEKRFLAKSILKLPHLAPQMGYEPTRRYEASTYKGWPPERAIGFFLRTRVQLNADGDIVSANYAKIYGDFRFDPRGTVRIWYYYNPTPNDYNLEFDPARNLFPRSMKGANVANP